MSLLLQIKMKPVKKHSVDASKNRSDEGNSTLKIKSYFKPTFKSFDVVRELKSSQSDTAKSYYVNVLQEKIDKITSKTSL